MPTSPPPSALPQPDSTPVPECDWETPLRSLILDHGPPVGIAVSGGLDSMTLLQGAVRLRAQLTHPPLMYVVHVNHGLRGPEASEKEAACVRKACESLEISADFLDLDLLEPGEAISEVSNLEAKARTARYRAFQSWVNEHSIQILLLAHHKDDQAETVLMRLHRGSGPRGLRGIPKDRRLNGRCRLARPWLGLTRAELESLASAWDVPYVSDPSNLNPKWLRNQIRHQWLPAIEAQAPEFKQRLHQLSRRAEAAFDALQDAREALLPSVEILRTPAIRALDVEALKELPPALAFHIAESLGPKGMSQASWELLLPLLNGAKDHAMLEGEVQATVNSGVLWLTNLGAQSLTEEGQPIAHKGRAKLPALGGEIHAFLSHGNAYTLIRRAGQSGWKVALDADAIQGTLTVRARKDGDRYRPLRAPGTRKLKDILNGAGIPSPLRPWLPVIADDLGPLWCPPGPPAHRARLSDSTQNAWIVSLDGPLSESPEEDEEQE